MGCYSFQLNKQYTGMNMGTKIKFLCPYHLNQYRKCIYNTVETISGRPYTRLTSVDP